MTMQSLELMVLLAIGCQIDAPSVGRHLSITCGEATDLLRAATDRRWLSQTKAPEQGGFLLTDEGRISLDAELERFRGQMVPRQEVVLSRFEPLDRQFKNLVIQITETGMDDRGLARMDRVVSKSSSLLKGLSAWGVRFSTYTDRLDLAMQSLLMGHVKYLLDPAVDNVHSVWWECHTDIKLVAGVSG